MAKVFEVLVSFQNVVKNLWRDFHSIKHQSPQFGSFSTHILKHNILRVKYFKTGFHVITTDNIMD